MNLSPTALRAVEAYGGRSLWTAGRAVESTLSAGGLAFRLKWQRPFVRVKCRFELGRPSASIQAIDREGNTGILDGHDVRIVDGSGRVVESRPAARKYFPYGRRALWWDRLDQTYFAGYALWNYMTLPSLLLQEDIAWREVEEGVLDATFPPHLPTHCERQRFRFDLTTGLLRQHDYTAEVIGGWANAAMVIREHAFSDGITHWSYRTATPRKASGEARRGPVLVEVRVHEWRMLSS